MIKKYLRDSINKLSESEAKTVLLQTFIRVKMMQESKESQKQMINDLYSWYNDIIQFPQTNKVDESKYETVHLVCGEAPAGSLRVGLERENKVIGFPDFFAVGPVRELHKEVGLKRRYEWLKAHLNIPENYLEEEYENRFLKTIEEIFAIPNNVKIVIWTAENADEQTGLRFILYLLKERTNDVFLINSTIAYQDLFNTSEFQYLYFHTGEVIPEKLNLINQKKLRKPLTIEERKRYEKEWMIISDTKEILRIWENKKIKAVNENYFDNLIVSCAQKLHVNLKEKEFVESGRLIGEVLGQIENNGGDAFLEYRLRCLIYSGVFEIKGIPKGMRYYSVKLR